MRKPKITFISLHYGWILTCTLLAFPILYPYGNLAAVDVFFFGSSGSTESGLNTIDVNSLATYQQVYIYIIPTITNLMFVNIAVVTVRLYWFRRRLSGLARHPYATVEEGESGSDSDREREEPGKKEEQAEQEKQEAEEKREKETHPHPQQENKTSVYPASQEWQAAAAPRRTAIKFDEAADDPRRTSPPAQDHPLRIPGPREREAGEPPVEVGSAAGGDDEPAMGREDLAGRQGQRTIGGGGGGPSGLSRRRTFGFDADGPAMQVSRSMERAATSIMALGHTSAAMAPRSKGLPGLPGLPGPSRRNSGSTDRPLPQLSRQATVGRNSRFQNLTRADRERLGGIEYRALRLLMAIVLLYFVGLHLLGVVFLLPWIHGAPQRYLDWLDECGQGRSWWAFYSAQTMINNLGFTLTPDSMMTFRDATWPMLSMTFLALAGNTFYPILLRLVIWTAMKLSPAGSPARADLTFLLDHPRRCYTLLFPSRPTWILLLILSALNLADVVLIIALDLRNPAVNDLPMGPRILSALFQAASARHTGTSTLALADVSPAVQFSLLAMMYIAVFPIAISVRASNTYEERSLGLYEQPAALPDEAGSSRSYIMTHIRNQLSFDLWYVFLGTFIICAAEADHIMDGDDPAFAVFPVLFECVSAYGNVGLSLGHPDVMTSLCGRFSPFSKVVVCLLMLRGRHRMLPYALDRAIMLPDEARVAEEEGGRPGMNEIMVHDER